MTATTAAAYWTVAYRKPRANRFLRVDLALTWEQARAVAAAMVEAMPGFEVFYTTNAEAERTGYTPAEDAGNIMVDSGRRIAVREGGTLPAGVAERLAEITAEATAKRAAEDQMADFAEAHGVARWITDRPAAEIARQGWFLRAVEAAHAEALAANAVEIVTPGEAAAADVQVRAWLNRHAALGTDASRQAYATIAYRMADEIEAHAENADRDAAARWDASQAENLAEAARTENEAPGGMYHGTEWASTASVDTAGISEADVFDLTDAGRQALAWPPRQGAPW